ncbi:TPA: hypothetical protein DIU27_04645 [Candidatus Collierbacteria bacterium]|uniref:Uncharacterized protein n=1 Tax=Candidatus Collierbacteria bacterium GW2011_GWB2_44_22 TaxID=1618387 RepID=A0A0G1HYV3_9BACT|nr:MAG: hypothetical protein UW31_C0011G0007 [Candidatus Collierbacteria bacterium GW2011_GWA2_44_13]KKT51753.1 MAG: hypothetical protein UW44_C0008G0075 [Candidatus Collierbacteria bacterium GW2011_GWB2_44_22]KKT63655.1 MAG: hypothetical protein UW58_C0054G0005 [Candidatus Collierbacteria bacterium GW2011_GWC2_44_30]KKT68289.1 MAG: hypothetical protein UW64_C0023G0005 [Microgenomates group bacterium GW2011_GWC1_44_37]KKT88234.1 MAG: hypothetical protein UW88_C0013G0003 [Candidatus Collierbacte
MKRNNSVKIFIAAVLFVIVISGAYYFGGKQQAEAPAITQTPTSDTRKITVDNFRECQVYQRSNTNIPPNNTTLSDRSEVRCEVNGQVIVVFSITDKPGFEDASNSIYRFWKDSEGYKTLIVDQNGAGSGEGNGKILLVKPDGYEVLKCFYFTAEAFSGSFLEPPSDSELDIARKSSVNLANPVCNNFVLISNL